MVTDTELFATAIDYPDPDAQDRYAALVGIDDIKTSLLTHAQISIDPDLVAKWSRRHHRSITTAAMEVTRRAPLVVLEGDVGTGKTELAESFPDALARSAGIQVTLYPLSLAARGHGAVGEMTTLITQAFTTVRLEAAAAAPGDGRVRHAFVLFIDEADSLAQSREMGQMHHEDRAGVNALIRGVDQLRTQQLPVLTVLSTNRAGALDPAVLRRAAAVFSFQRPGTEARVELLRSLLTGHGVISEAELADLATATGPNDDRDYGFTFSDIRQRLLPTAVLDALQNDTPMTAASVLQVAQRMEPTRPFGTRP